ncbi:hypothetical protein PDJ82_26795 [Bacillus cereus group sp. TH43LC]|uniref:hypothetical protein n=1 Tax=Bacillus cereus group TaxID=86661 RepID=UPI0022E33B28|nr:hypothetical protein [Bacillus cereus group sp. TH43LC]MDA1505177.1 hypothetical protein [Bacillus cereus group sp. TH43LC]
MNYSEIIINGGLTIASLFILYNFLLLLFYYIGGEYKEDRVEELKVKSKKEKVSRLRNTSYRRGIR